MKRNDYKTINISYLVFVVLAVSFFAISAKVLLVACKDTTDGINLTEFTKNRNTGKEVIKAERGTIFSGDGEALAITVNSYTTIAYLDESRTVNEDNPKHVVNKELTAEKLSEVLGMSKEYILKLLNQDLYQVELGPNGRGITELVKKRIEALELPGIDFIDTSKRTYPMGSLAPYVIGFAQTNDEGKIIGKMGIEREYQTVLEGKDGSKTYQKDPYGYTIPNTIPIIEDAEQGQDIYLTIDSRIQMFVQDAIAEMSQDATMDWITFSVMDAKTGAVVATGSNPTFNLNKLNIQSYVNPLTSYSFEPGSTMKIFSFLASMEAGQYNGEEIYQSGTVKVDDAIIKDFNTKGWGPITYNEGFAYSSNTAATYLALKLGGENLRNFYSSLGFGKETGIELPEEKGKINFQYKTEIATASFGQGKVMTTPIQNLQALTILTNGGIQIQPYLIDKIVDSETGKVTYEHEITELGQKITPENAKKMLDLMYDVVYSGKTDARFYKANNVTLIGKTGTAQMTGGSGLYLEGKYDYIRSFAGIFPYEDPKYIIYVSTKRYTGNYRKFAETVAKVVEEIAKYKNITHKINDIDTSKIHTIKNYISTDVKTAEENIRYLQLQPIIIGDGKYVKKQYPDKGTTIMAGQKVYLVTNSAEHYLPDLTGWKNSDVTILCKLLQIPYVINGNGRVTQTNYPAGTNIKEITNLEITMG